MRLPRLNGLRRRPTVETNGDGGRAIVPHPHPPAYAYFPMFIIPDNLDSQTCPVFRTVQNFGQPILPDMHRNLDCQRDCYSPY